MLTPKHKERETESFVEVPNGIFTKDGIWFHTTMKLLDRYARELWTHVSKKELIMAASNQIKSIDLVGIITLCLATLSVNVWSAIPLSLVVIVLYWSFLPTIASRGFSEMLKPLHNDIFLIVLGVLAFSSLGIASKYVDLGIAITLFLFLKFGWLGAFMQKRRERSDLPNTFNDRVLKMIIIKESMKHGVSTHEIDTMERDILDFLNKKTGKKR